MTMENRKKLSIGLMATLSSPKYREQIIGCDETWCQSSKCLDVPVFHFVGSIEHTKTESLIKNSKIIHLENVADDYLSATYKQWKGLEWMHRNSPSDYYFLAGTDNYINMKKLANIIKKYEPLSNQLNMISSFYEQVRYVCDYQCAFALGGGGYALSNGFMNLIVDRIDDIIDEWDQDCIKYNHKTFMTACDLSLTHLCKKLEVDIIRAHGLYCCSWTGAFVNPVMDNFPVGGMNEKEIVVCHYMERKDMHLMTRYMYVVKSYKYILNRFRQLKHINGNPGKVDEINKECEKLSKIVVVGDNKFEYFYSILFGLVNNMDVDQNLKELTYVSELELPESNIMKLCKNIGVKFNVVDKVNSNYKDETVIFFHTEDNEEDCKEKTSEYKNVLYYFK